jgi:hypothetical protein
MVLLFPARNGRRNGTKEKRTRRMIGLRLALVRSSRLAGETQGPTRPLLLAACSREWLEQGARRADGWRRSCSGGRASGRLSAAARLESGEREERGSEGERD